MSLRDEAISNLTQKLREGAQVGTCTFRDLIDCEMNEPDASARFQKLLTDLDTLLRKDGGDDTVEGFASTMFERICKDYLERHAYLIDEEIAAILEEHAEVE